VTVFSSVTVSALSIGRFSCHRSLSKLALYIDNARKRLQRILKSSLASPETSRVFQHGRQECRRFSIPNRSWISLAQRSRSRIRLLDGRPRAASYPDRGRHCASHSLMMPS